MSVLLRCPEAVPALFGGSAEADGSMVRHASRWRRLVPASPVALAAGSCAATILIDVPLVKAAMAAVGFALRG